MIAKTDLDKFRDFTPDQWAGWIRAFLTKRQIAPVLPVWEDRYAEKLISLFKQIDDPSAATRFADSLARIFETTSAEQKFTEWLYIELHALAVAVSDYAKGVVRRRLYEEALADLTFARTDLHALLLAVNGVYHIDDQLADYIRSSAKSRASDLTYLKVCFRLLGRKSSPWDIRMFLDRILPLLKAPEDERRFAEELITLTFKQRWRFLYMFYLECAGEPGGHNSLKAETLRKLIREHVIPVFVDQEAMPLDEFFVVTDFLANLDPQFLTADQLFTVLNTVAGMESMEDKEASIQGLRLAYRMTAGAWDIDVHSVDVPCKRTMNEPKSVALVVRAAKDTHKMFDADKDKELLRILTRTLPRSLPWPPLDPFGDSQRPLTESVN